MNKQMASLLLSMVLLPYLIAYGVQSQVSEANEPGLIKNHMNVKSIAVPYKSLQTRIIVTTDGECDDQNSLRHLLLYANDFDIAGIVYSSSMFHFQGDEKHTLKEVTPHFLCEAKDAGGLMSYRPQEMGWIENAITNEYTIDYKYLVQNDPNYPSPEYLLSIIKIGNVEFEGDVRSATEGSYWIKKCILDADKRKLYIEAWGGFNTVARALLSIAEEFKGTDQWDSVYAKVCQKVVIQGHGQDNSWKDYIVDLYPDLVTYSGSSNGYGYFGKYTASEQARYMFQGDWLSKNVKINHGELMSNYHLMGDGAYYYGEPDYYQYGQLLVIDWAKAGIVGFPARQFDKYDWLAEGDSGTWIQLIPVGLRGLENPNYGTWGGRISVNKRESGIADFNNKRTISYPEYNYITGEIDDFSAKRWLEKLQLDWAARCDWTVNSYDDCNHAPKVSARVLNITAKAGEVVKLEGIASDPDGDGLNIDWWVYKEAGKYSGVADGLNVWNNEQLTTIFTIPKDSLSGDYFNIILEVSDDAVAPMTRYAQLIVTVK